MHHSLSVCQRIQTTPAYQQSVRPLSRTKGKQLTYRVAVVGAAFATTDPQTLSSNSNHYEKQQCANNAQLIEHNNANKGIMGGDDNRFVCQLPEHASLHCFKRW
jgi:hypothetical protein